MSHWAKIDENNIVVMVVVGDNNDPSGDEGESWINNTIPGTWIKTSYNGNIRKNYAQVGGTYDYNLDAFIPVKPYDSWVLDEETATWNPPHPAPEDGNFYNWNESLVDWEVVEVV